MPPMFQPTRQPARQPAHARSRWFAQEPALALMGAEQRALIPSITAVYGSAGLYLRPCESAPAELSGNMVLSILRLHGDGVHFDGDLRCAADQLPIADDSMSLVYALHAFDTCPDPSLLAAEAARVLTPEGILVVVGLNPFSPWMLRWAGRGPRWRAAGPLRGQLAAHGLDVFRRDGVGPVWRGLRDAGNRQQGGRDRVGRNERAMDWLGPVRAGYALLARKRRVGFTALPLGASRPALGLKPFVHTGSVHVRRAVDAHAESAPMAMSDS